MRHRFRWITEGATYLYCAAPGKGADHLRGQTCTAITVPRAGSKPSNVLVQFPCGAQHIVPLGTLKKGESMITDGFPTAQQAKDAADRVKENKVQEQLDNVRKLVEQAMQRGEYHCYPRMTLLWEVENYLKGKGFTITSEVDHDIQGPVTITKIVWGSL